MGDRLLEVVYVDSRGELVTLSSQDDLDVFGGSMGMMGIVVSLTYRLEEMSYARYWPQSFDGGLSAILPKPGQGAVPNQTVEWMNHYYSEFIQYPTHHNSSGVLWKNTWDNKGRAEDSVTLTDATEDEFQRDQLFLNTVAVEGFKTIQKMFPDNDYLHWLFGYTIGLASTIMMKDWEKPLTTTVTEAMHFQRGLHFLSVRAAEMIVPIPALDDGTPDWSLVQEIVWDLGEVLESFESRNLYPVDLAVEDRFMSSTSMLLGAQYGNTYSIAIEVTSSLLVDLELWEELKVAIASNWSKYNNKNAKGLWVRPHWAKEMPREVGGVPILEYMQEAYRDQIPMYLEEMERVVLEHEGRMGDTVAMFSTKYLQHFFDESL